MNKAIKYIRRSVNFNYDKVLNFVIVIRKSPLRALRFYHGQLVRS